MAYEFSYTQYWLYFLEYTKMLACVLGCLGSVSTRGSESARLKIVY